MIRFISTLLVLALAACGSSLPPEYRAMETRADLRPRAETNGPQVDLSGPLTLEMVTREVLAHNQRVEAMRHTWRAMIAMAPQVAAIPDPTLELGITPLAIPTGRGQRLSYRQSLPWPGASAARARVALEDAAAMEHDLLAMKRSMVAMAHMAYWELAAAGPLRALWHKHHALIQTLRQATLGRVQANKARPQDAVRAEAELVMAEQMLIDINRMESIAAARLNTAMQRAPDSPLGLAALPDSLPSAPPPLADLTQHFDRAELAAALARAKAKESQIGAVERMNRPMLGWGVELSTMEDDWMMWPMIMVMIELPFSSARRDAMVDEAKATAAAAKANAAGLHVELQREVAERRAELVDALARHQNYATLLVPTLERRLSLTVASYGAGQDDFDAVMMAATALNDAQVGMLEAKVAALVAATGLDLSLGRLVEAQ